MNHGLHFTVGWVLLAVYACLTSAANAQFFDDASIQISNQINDNVTQVLTAPATDQGRPPVPGEAAAPGDTKKAIAYLLSTRKDFFASLVKDGEVHDFAHALHSSPMSRTQIQQTVDTWATGSITPPQFEHLVEYLARTSPPPAPPGPSGLQHPLSGGGGGYQVPPIPACHASWKDYGDVYVTTETVIFPDSKWTDGGLQWKDTLRKSQVAYTAKFDEKNSFIGKGLTDAYTNQLSWLYAMPFALTIQPGLSYQESDTDSHGIDTFHGNTFGASTNFALKVLPFDAITNHQPNASMNLAPDSDIDGKPCPYQPWTKPDQYPSCDLLLNLNVGFNDANTKTLTRNWAYSTQDMYALSPGVIFDFYNRKDSRGIVERVKQGIAEHDGVTWLLPDSITINPLYSYGMTENQIGKSASMGILTIKNQNTYLIPLSGPANDMDCDKAPRESLQVAEINSINHDTNQEGLTPPAGHIEYQNWAQFGFALIYTVQPHQDPAAVPDPCDLKAIQPPPFDPGFRLQSIRAEYDYTAFNNQYEEHTVTLTANFAF